MPHSFCSKNGASRVKCRGGAELAVKNIYIGWQTISKRDFKKVCWGKVDAQAK